MSFLFDIPALFIIGTALYLVGRRYDLERLSKITIGLLIALSFISLSFMLYTDIFQFPAVNFTSTIRVPENLSGSDFTINWPYYPVIEDNSRQLWHKEDFPPLLAFFIFLLYPVAIYAGYASALLYSKKRSRRVSTEYKSYRDVRSRSRIAKDPRYSVLRYPDNQKGINNLKEAVKGAVEDLGGMRRFVRRNDKVLIKANICGGNPDNPATYTSQEVVGYIVDMVRDAGGEPFVCDADMIWAKFWVQVKAAGWDVWARKKNVELVNLSGTELVYFDFGEGSAFQHNELPNQEVVSKRVLDADVIISVPKMKTHLHTNVTLGMKNIYGTLPDEDKARYHQTGGIEEVIYWVNYAFTPTLTIIDGSTGGEAEGPLSARLVQFNTIIASDNVVLADAVASKLMGYEQPFDSIIHLKIARYRMGGERSLIGSIPGELYFTAAQLVTALGIPANPKDGKWQLADPDVVNETTHFMENLLGIPGATTLYNIGADFILMDAARLPFWKVIQGALMQLLFAPRFWVKKTRETSASKNRMRLNLAIFSAVVLLSIFFLSTCSAPDCRMPDKYTALSPGKVQSENDNMLEDVGYIPNNVSDWNRSFIYIFGFIIAIILGALFARLMETRHLAAAIISSMVVAYFIESWAPHAGWWSYLHERNLNDSLNNSSYILGQPLSGLHDPPLYPLFAVPIFIISIIGLSLVLSPVLSVIGQNNKRFRLIPYAVVMLALFTFLYLERYLTPAGASTIDMIVIYAALAVLALYFNEKQTLEKNLAFAIVAVVLGFTMEYFGALAGFWGYPRTLNMTLLDISLNNCSPFNMTYQHLSTSAFTRLPIFVGFTWALNVWAACGLAMIFGVDLGRAFVRDDAFDTDDPRAWCHRGDTLTDQRKHEEAISHYDKAIEMNPRMADAHFGKGAALACIGDYTNSLSAYSNATDLYVSAYPQSAEDHAKIAQALYRRAVAAQNLGMADNAIETYSQAIDACRRAVKSDRQFIGDYIDMCIDKALAFHCSGMIESSIGTYREAINALRASVASSDEKSLMHAELLDFTGMAKLYRADTQGRTDLYKEALEEFNEAKMHSSRCADRTWLSAAHWGAGCALARLGRCEDAQNAFQKSIIEMSPRNAAFVWSDQGDSLLCIGECHYEAGDYRAAEKSYREALDAYEKAVRLYPELLDVQSPRHWRRDASAICKLEASIWAGIGDAHSGIAQCVSRCMGSSSKISKGMAKLAARLKDEEDFALKAYRRSTDILDKLPMDSDARSGKGYALRKMGRYKEALRAYDEAISIAWQDLPGKAVFQDSPSVISMSLAKAITGRGDVLMETGMYGEALDAFKESVEDAPDYMPSYLSMGIACIKLGQVEESKKAFQIALNMVPEGTPAYSAISGIMQGKAELGIVPALGLAPDIKARNAKIWQNRGAYLSTLR